VPRTGRSPSLRPAALPDESLSLRHPVALRRDRTAPTPIRRTLDRQRPEPLWHQLLEDLRQRLDDGEFPDRLPTEAELTATYGVSRQTVREALRRLVAEGRLARRRGRGTAVRPAEFAQPVGGLFSLFHLIEAQGVPQTNQVLALERRQDPEAALALGRAAEEPLVYLERLRLAGEHPLALDRVWLPAELAEPLLEVDFHRTALYEELARWCGVRPDSGEEEIRPVLPDPIDRLRLGMGARQAALAVERRTFAEGRAVERRRILLRGDRIGIVARWPQGTAPEPAMPASLRLTPLEPLADDQPGE